MDKKHTYVPEKMFQTDFDRSLSLSISGLGTSLHSERPGQLPHPRLSSALHRPLQVLKFSMFLDLSPFDLLFKQTPLTKTLIKYFRLCNSVLQTMSFPLLFYVSQTVVLWSRRSNFWKCNWLNFLLPHPNFKGLWKDVIILVFLLYCPLFFVPRCVLRELICSLSTERWEMNSKKRRICEGLFVKKGKKEQTCFWERQTEAKCVGDPKQRLSCLFMYVFSFLYQWNARQK